MNQNDQMFASIGRSTIKTATLLGLAAMFAFAMCGAAATFKNALWALLPLGVIFAAVMTLAYAAIAVNVDGESC